MSDDYQLRKDIDNVILLADALKEAMEESGISNLKDFLLQQFDESDFDFMESQLNSNLNVLDTDLDTLKESLTDFNQSLITFNGDATTLANDLTTLSTNLNSVLGDLNSLDSSLTNLDGDLDNLKTTIHTFSQYLTDFNGTLTEFKQDLEDDGVVISELDQSIIAMFEAIDETQTAISSVEEDIGTPSTVGTVKYNIAQAQSSATTANNTANNLRDNTIPSVQTDISDVQSQMYKGSGGTGTTSNPANGTVMKDINNVQSDIGDVETDVNGDLQSQIYDILKLFDGVHELWYPVESLEDVAAHGDISLNSRGNVNAKADFEYTQIYVKSTGKYYIRRNLWGE